jgi:spore coat protein U-like protein
MPPRLSSAIGLAVSLGLLLGAQPPLRAATGTTNLNVSATVSLNCTITTTPVAFGAYDPVVANAATPLDATGTVVVACTKGSTATIGLGLGANAQTSARRMLDGATNFLGYEIYLDTTRTTVWGTATTGLLSTGVAPSKAARTFTVYGRVAANQDVPAGAFTDIVVATVNF